MARVDVLQQAFNVGVYDRDKLHRVDITKFRLAAERQTNILADVVGKGFLRPGTQYIATLAGAAQPVLFDAGDNAYVLALTNLAMAVLDVSTDTMLTRPAVTSAVTNGDFSAGASWTLASTSGQTTTISGGKLNMTARAHGGKAVATQQVTCSGGNIGVEHALRVVVDRGPVWFRVGSSSGGQQYVAATQLRKGTHSLAFTPTGDFYIEFSSFDPCLKIVDSCTVEAAGVVSIPTQWPTAALPLIRRASSLDVMYCATDGYKEQRIERRNGGTTAVPIAGRSWSVCDEDRTDGPFQLTANAPVRLTPSVLEGNGTLTASAPFFQSGHVGALFRLFHEGQNLDTYIAGENQYTDAFLVTGITETNFEERKYSYTLAGTWVGTVRNRRSYDDEFGDYHDFRRAQTVATVDITANASYTNDDNDDNIDIWVKLGIPAGLYTSGEVHITSSYPNGGGYGICRVVGFTSSTQVDIEILRPFKGTTAVDDWRQSRYDGVSGYPSAVAFDDGRLVWMGDDLIDASISDAYESFDEDFAGDAGPLSRSIALGGRNDVKWGLSLSSLMIGCNRRIANVRASSLDEVLTPDNFGLKSSGRVGAAAIDPVELADDRGLFIQASGKDLYEVTWSAEKARYVTAPFTKLTSSLFTAGITGMDIQTLPDQRIWVTNTDASAVCILFEPTEDVLGAHITISTSTATDFFYRFCVAPGSAQDRVYAVVKRVVNGSTVYLLEKLALDTEALPATVCKVMDAHVTGTGAHSATITGLTHLEGRSVVAWVDGAPVLDSSITTPGDDNAKVFTVSGGQITLPVAPTAGYCVGLAYDGQFKSARLAYGVQGYTPMLKNKGLAALGILLGDYCRSGVKYGTVKTAADFSTPWSLPTISSTTGDTATEVVSGPADDEIEMPAGSEIGLDMRVCVAFRSPKPASLLSLVLAIETYG